MSSAEAAPRRLQRDERAGVSPHLAIGARNDCGFHHLRMAVENFLDFERGDVFAAGDDDVLGAVLHLDAAVGVPGGEIARAVHAAGKGLVGCGLVLEIALHQRVAGQCDLADGRAVARTGARVCGSTTAMLLDDGDGNALARHARVALSRGQGPPIPACGGQ